MEASSDNELKLSIQAPIQNKPVLQCHDDGLALVDSEPAQRPSEHLNGPAPIDNLQCHVDGLAPIHRLRQLLGQ